MPIERAALTVYSRKDCHLCDEMIGALHRLRVPVPVEVTRVDIDGDAELQRRHGEFVPVLMHGDRKLCHYALDITVVTAYLANFR